MITCPKLVILLLAVVIVGQTNADDDEEVVRFTVDPAGATTHHTAKLGKIKCIFSYSAVGGTREEWVMTLARRSDKYTCDIERPEGTSYMYFQSFAGSLTKVTLESAELFDNNGALLLNEDFLIKENTVFQGPSFQSNFVSLRMVGKKDH